LSDDADGFVELCSRGEIYETLAEKTGLPREEVNRRFFAIAYGSRRDMGTRVGLVFQELFPGAFRALSEMKPLQRLSNGHEQTRDPAHGELARQMQRLESQLLIGRVCKRLYNEAPAACLLTIHDCLVTTASEIDRFRRVLIGEFVCNSGVRPQARISWFAEG
jgi:hypothetical protein